MKKGIILGYVISNYGIKFDKVKTNLIVNFSLPTYVKDEMFFLGHAGFFHHFIKDFSKIVRPLTNLLAIDVSFHFSKECHVAFTKLKETLIYDQILHGENNST